jgi:hypothetical protein
VLVTLNLMEPDPRTPFPSVGFVLWVIAFVLAVVVGLARLAT